MVRDYSLPVDDHALATAKAALEANGFTVEVVEKIEDVKSIVIELIPKGSEVFTATSVTLDATGLSQELNESDKWVSVRHKFMPLYGQPDKAVEMHRIGSGSDYTVGSVTAVTQDGKVLIASATGSQLPNYAYGARHVIWVVGTQKIVKDLNEAMERLETYTFQLEDQRAQDAYGIHSVISKTLLYHNDYQHRVHIILVKEGVGF